MAEVPCVGVDFGELVLRAAYATGGRSTILPAEMQAREPAIFFDPGRNISSLGVGFPSVLQSVGSGLTFNFANRSETPDVLVKRQFSTIFERIMQHVGALPGSTTIAAPSALNHRKRKALLDCAQEAGFSQVALIDRPIAAAFAARAEPDQSATYIVICIDYDGCEISLIRMARGRCWAVGTSLLPQVSGEQLDALVMQDIILALREHQIFLGLKSFPAMHWLEFRRAAEMARLQMARQPVVQVRLGQGLTGTNDVVVLRLRTQDYFRAVQNQIAPVIEAVNSLLERNSLEPSSVDTTLLVGEVAIASPAAQFMRRAFGGALMLADENLAAVGALVHAAESAGVSWVPNLAAPGLASTEMPDSKLIPVDKDARSQTTDGRAQFSKVKGTAPSKSSVTEPMAAVPSVESTPILGATDGSVNLRPGEWLAEVRRMAKQGRLREAADQLASMARDLEALRAEINAKMPTPAQRLIQQAQAMVVDGRYLEAISLSHSAYNAAPNDPEVFSGMMKVHSEAGVAMDRPEQYDDAIQILSCALRHDQTDRSLHKALAQRHFLQAAAMFRLHNYDRVEAALQQALTFDPKHVEANELRAQMSN